MPSRSSSLRISFVMGLSGVSFAHGARYFVTKAGPAFASSFGSGRSASAFRRHQDGFRPEGAAAVDARLRPGVVQPSGVQVQGARRQVAAVGIAEPAVDAEVQHRLHRHPGGVEAAVAAEDDIAGRDAEGVENATSATDATSSASADRRP
jgi:hypothetical protein